MKNVTHIVAFVLVIVGALNWGLVGLFDFNLVDAVFGAVSWLERLIYVLVGVAAVVLLATHKKDCRYCTGGVGAKSAVMPPPPPTT